MPVFGLTLLIVPFMQMASGKSVATTTTDGPIEGIFVETEIGTKGNVFRGIPYGKAPVGELRWQKPQPPEPWQQPLDCKNWGPRCPQFEPPNRPASVDKPDGVTDSEDCLRLNVYTPADASRADAKLPVLFWVHGGGFLWGSAVEFGVDGVLDSFVRRDVVVVTVQYRLGPLGFMKIVNDEKKTTANAALWDLSLALDWVHKNIGGFGGDPKKITAAGHSAGAVIVSLMSQSKVTSGKFHALALFSGASVAQTWLHLNNFWVAEAQSRFATLAECNYFSSEMFDCLRKKSPDELIKIFAVLQSEMQKTPFQTLFLPTIDGEFLSEPADAGLMHAPPHPTWLAVTENEMQFLRAFIPELPLPGWKADLQESLPKKLYKNHEHMQKLATEEYLEDGDTNDSQFVLTQFIKYWSDRLFYASAQGEATLRRRTGAKVWLSEFAYWKPDALIPNVAKGAYHALDMVYLFGHPVISLLNPPFKFDENDKIMADKYSAMLANFVKHHTPNDSSWPSVSASRPDVYKVVDIEDNVKDGFHRSAAQFWNKVFPVQAEVDTKYPAFDTIKSEIAKDERRKHQEL